MNHKMIYYKQINKNAKTIHQIYTARTKINSEEAIEIVFLSCLF